MSAYNSGFVTGTGSIGGDTLEPFVPVHERPEEEIQGGAAGEHYHLTETEYEAVQDLAEIGIEPALKIYEPVADGDSVDELLYEELADGSFDVLVDFGGNYAS